jgi:hypothetical protein
MSVEMPFGKHRGRLLSEIPEDYLEWLLTFASKEWLKEAVQEELDTRRSKENQQTAEEWAKGGGRGVEHPDLHNLFRTWFAGLARDYHPDRMGGDGRPMAAINDAAQRLRRLLEDAV